MLIVALIITHIAAFVAGVLLSKKLIGKLASSVDKINE